MNSFFTLKKRAPVPGLYRPPIDCIVFISCSLVANAAGFVETNLARRSFLIVPHKPPKAGPRNTSKARGSRDASAPAPLNSSGPPYTAPATPPATPVDIELIYLDR